MRKPAGVRGCTPPCPWQQDSGLRCPLNCLPLGSCILKKAPPGHPFSPAQPVWFCKLISPAFPWFIHGPQSRGHRDKPLLGLSQLVIAAQFPALCKATWSSASLPPKLARPGTSGTLWRGSNYCPPLAVVLSWMSVPQSLGSTVVLPGDLYAAQTS